MTMRFVSMAACLALAAPTALLAQTDGQEDDAVDLDAIDALLGNADVTGGEDADAAGEASESDDGDASDEDTDDESSADDDAEEAEVSDLTRAFTIYSLCASEAGAALEETGFSLDVIGQEALLRCSGQRAAYVNAFYFSLVPRFPGSSEAEVRVSAERLVAQSDTAIANLVTREVTDLREIREADAAAEAAMEAEQASEDDMDAPPENTPDGENTEKETDPNA
jgi:hypothetical protein